MSYRDEIIAYLGLPAEADLFEIEHAYIARCNSLSERLSAGDESARVELVALEEAFGRLMGYPSPPGGSPLARGGISSAAASAETYSRAPAWYECYLALLCALASAALFGALIAYLPHVYHKSGFAIPLAMIASSALLSIFGTILAEGEFRQGQRMRILHNRGLGGDRRGRVRYQAARLATILGRYERWLIVPALVVTLFLNFASLTKR
jgi:hypothetical protein